jgi:hypothetical protein
MLKYEKISRIFKSAYKIMLIFAPTNKDKAHVIKLHFSKFQVVQR